MLKEATRDYQLRGQRDNVLPQFGTCEVGNDSAVYDMSIDVLPTALSPTVTNLTNLICSVDICLFSKEVALRARGPFATYRGMHYMERECLRR